MQVQVWTLRQAAAGAGPGRPLPADLAACPRRGGLTVPFSPAMEQGEASLAAQPPDRTAPCQPRCSEQVPMGAGLGTCTAGSLNSRWAPRSRRSGLPARLGEQPACTPRKQGRLCHRASRCAGRAFSPVTGPWPRCPMWQGSL